MYYGEFKKEKDTDQIWWADAYNDRGSLLDGQHCFSFDKIKVYNLFRDYPHNMTDEEVEIFDKENSFWANFFRWRKEK